MTDVWIVIVEDRHIDVDAFPFSGEQRAAEFAREQVRANAAHPEYVSEQELTPAMRDDGWVLLIEYGTEGDCVRVIKRTVDAEP